MYLFFPYINKMLNCISKEQHLYVAVLRVTVFLFIYTFTRATWLGGTNSIFIFLTLYVVVAYIRRFNQTPKVKWTMVLGIFIIEYISMILMNKMGQKEFPVTYFVWETAKFFPVINSIVMFFLFRKLIISEKLIRPIEFCASSVFGVYLFHIGDLRYFLFGTLFNNSVTYSNSYMILQVLCCMISILGRWEFLLTKCVYIF